MPQFKVVCVTCGALYKDGFVEPHIFPCANQEYNWHFVMTVLEDWIREGMDIEAENEKWLKYAVAEGFWA